MNKKQVIIVSIILLLIFSAFYWFSWRPVKIRKSCALTSANFTDDFREDFYKNCILQNGLKP